MQPAASEAPESVVARAEQVRLASGSLPAIAPLQPSPVQTPALVQPLPAPPPALPPAQQFAPPPPQGLVLPPPVQNAPSQGIPSLGVP